jgi:multidrug resistance efflux pump
MYIIRKSLLVLTLTFPIVVAGCGRPTVGGAAETNANAGATAVIERVTAGAPQRKDLTLRTTQPASIDAYETTPLSPKVAGYVGEVLVDIGDRVTAGQVLLRLTAPEMLDERGQKQALHQQAKAEIGQAQSKLTAAQAGVASAQARVAQAEAVVAQSAASLEQYRTEHSRISELAAARSVTQQLADESLSKLRAAEAGQQAAQAGVELARAELLESESGVPQAQADIDAAAAREQVAAADLAYVETMLGYLELKAPYDGVVSQRNVDTGHFVRASSESAAPLLVVARTDTLRVFVDVPEAEAAFVTSGDAGDSATVRVQALSNRESNPKSRARAGRLIRPTGHCMSKSTSPIQTVHCGPECMPLRPSYWKSGRTR